MWYIFFQLWVTGSTFMLDREESSASLLGRLIPCANWIRAGLETNCKLTRQRLVRAPVSVRKFREWNMRMEKHKLTVRVPFYELCIQKSCLYEELYMTETPYNRFWFPKFGDRKIELYAIQCMCSSDRECSVDSVDNVYKLRNRWVKYVSELPFNDRFRTGKLHLEIKQSRLSIFRNF